jgi:hypothetical protein
MSPLVRAFLGAAVRARTNQSIWGVMGDGKTMEHHDHAIADLRAALSDERLLELLASVLSPIEVVESVQRPLGTLRGGAPSVTGYRFDYVRWIADSEQALSEVFFRSDVASLLHTPLGSGRSGEPVTPPQDFSRLFFSEVEAQHAGNPGNGTLGSDEARAGSRDPGSETDGEA